MAMMLSIPQRGLWIVSYHANDMARNDFYDITGSGAQDRVYANAQFSEISLIVECCMCFGNLVLW